MLRFYGLYKQAVSGPCTVSRPGFWDPVGRYKWDAWNQQGHMSRENAMATYVDEMKKVAQEVIDNMPINEKTASFFHYFEPLYHVIHDMPRPPEALLTLTSDVNAKEPNDGLGEHEEEGPTQELAPQEQDFTETVPDSEPQLESTALSDGQGPTSDSESEIFCDSLEQLGTVKVTQMGIGHGGEGAEDSHGPPMRRRNTGRESQQQYWRAPSGNMAQHYARWTERSGSGGGGGDNSEGGPDRLQDAQVQQQIILALRQLREDMQSVMERLEVVEGLATANAQNSKWRSHVQLTSPEVKLVTNLEKWWPFDISGRTLLLLLVWPFVTQGMVFLMRQRKRRLHVCI
ncbi:acyl-CoA-binding domain-containing protein 4 isoform X3 [Xyrauchen texanus]|nr:acyl-CoA-binding domain-containing protein 4 isoform X3 [Xyrauchen texanus]